MAHHQYTSPTLGFRGSVCFVIQEKPQELRKTESQSPDNPYFFTTANHSTLPPHRHCWLLPDVFQASLTGELTLSGPKSLYSKVGHFFPPKVSLSLQIPGPKWGFTNPGRTTSRSSPLQLDYPRTPYSAWVRTPEYSTMSSHHPGPIPHTHTVYHIYSTSILDFATVSLYLYYLRKL